MVAYHTEGVLSHSTCTMRVLASVLALRVDKSMSLFFLLFLRAIFTIGNGISTHTLLIRERRQGSGLKLGHDCCAQRACIVDFLQEITVLFYARHPERGRLHSNAAIHRCMQIFARTHVHLDTQCVFVYVCVRVCSRAHACACVCPRVCPRALVCVCLHLRVG